MKSVSNFVKIWGLFVGVVALVGYLVSEPIMTFTYPFTAHVSAELYAAVYTTACLIIGTMISILFYRRS